MSVLEYILYSLLALQLASVLFTGYGWWRLARTKPAPQPSTRLPLSVIIALRNEGGRVAPCLMRILQQDYPSFEVVAVCDRSTDDTWPQLQALAAQHPHLKILQIETLPQGWSGKKHAITTGIAAAQYDVFAFTDADCDVPAGWLRAVAAPMAAGKQVVLGYSPLYAAPGLVNLFSRFDTLTVVVQYLGWAAAGLPYMAVGRNVAYTRAFWQRTGGFQAHAHTPSGDDDIAINRHASAHEVALLTDATTHVYSFSQPTLAAWVRQKVRHVGAAHHYTLGSKLLLGLAAASQHLTLPMLLILCCVEGFAWQWIALWAAVYLVQAGVLYAGMRVLAHRAVPLYSLFYMPVLQTVLYVAVAIQRVALGGNSRWK